MIVVVIGLLMIVALLAMLNKSPSIPAAGALELNDALPVGKQLGRIATEDMTAAPTVSPEVARDMTRFETGWAALARNAADPGVREALFELDKRYVAAKRYPAFARTLEKAVDAAALLDAVADRLPAPARQKIRQEASVIHLFAPHLAWAYWRLGDTRAALAVAQSAAARIPESPDAHFILGFMVGQSAPKNDEDFAVIRDSFMRALELDPAYTGFTVGPREVTEQVQRLNARLGPPKKSAAKPLAEASPTPSQAAAAGLAARAVTQGATTAIQSSLISSANQATSTATQAAVNAADPEAAAAPTGAVAPPQPATPAEPAQPAESAEPTSPTPE